MSRIPRRLAQVAAPDLRDESEDDLAAARSIDGGVITQDGVSRLFAKRYERQLRYDHDIRAWFRWDGTHWKRDNKGLAFQYARELGREQSDGGTDQEKRLIRRTSFASGVERFAQTDMAFATTSDEWDRDPYLLGTAGGTVDLRTGRLRQSDPRDMITKVTTVAPDIDARCPLFLRFLAEITRDDDELIDFLQRWFGYCLTGDTREQLLCFAFGSGKNGKGVLKNVVTRIMGAYAATATMEAFTASKWDRHSTELAMLRGARLVTASETEAGRQWAEARIKMLTGGDEISARFMHRDNFTYRPTFKILISGNHRPVIRNVDDAMRRRFMLLPFTFQPARPDKTLEDRLMQEAPAIFRWMIEGCLRWQISGLNAPHRAIESTNDYLSSQDQLGEWLRTDCVVESTAKCTTAALHESYADYVRTAGERPLSQALFSEAMQNRGFTKDKNVRSDGKYARGFQGVRLRDGHQ